MEDYMMTYDEEYHIIYDDEDDNLVGEFVSGYFQGLWSIARIILIIIIFLIVLGVAL